MIKQRDSRAERAALIAHRWGLADAVAGSVAFVPPGLVFLLFAWRFVRFAFASQVAHA